jgi:transketolase
MNPAELKAIAKELSAEVIRMPVETGSGHPGGSFSCMDLLTILFLNELRRKPNPPQRAEWDRMVLSKGHCGPTPYAVLAKAGYFPREDLLTLRKLNSRLQLHREHHRYPILEASTGSLGQGLSISIRMALASKVSNRNNRTYQDF